MIDQRRRFVEVVVTYRCNLACKGCCRAGFYKGEIIPDITMGQYLQLLDKMEELGFNKDVLMTGGEPTLHPQLLDFMRIAKSRSFKTHICSNAHTQHTRDILGIIRRERLGRIHGGAKPNGSVAEFPSPYQFCSPSDLGLTRTICRVAVKCGISFDAYGFTPCGIGGIIAHWRCPEARTPHLEDLLNDEWVNQSLAKTCAVCGHNYWLTDLSQVEKVNGTYVTESWKKILFSQKG